MKQLDKVEEKEKVSTEIHDLVKRINDIMEAAPLFLKIEFIQNTGMHHGKNAHLCVFISETISY